MPQLLSKKQRSSGLFFSQHLKVDAMFTQKLDIAPLCVLHAEVWCKVKLTCVGPLEKVAAFGFLGACV